jgi:hypothetical protein
LKNAWPQFRTPSPTATTEEQFANAVRLVDNVDATAWDMSQTLEYKMNHDSADPKQNRERFQQLTQNPKVKIGKVFAADVRKSRIHPTVKKSPLGARPIGYLSPKLSPSWDNIVFISLSPHYEAGRKGDPGTRAKSAESRVRGLDHLFLYSPFTALIPIGKAKKLSQF